jgi:hypothetical protein
MSLSLLFILRQTTLFLETLTLHTCEGFPDEVAGFFVAAGYATLAMRAPQNDRLFLILIVITMVNSGA